MTKFKTLINAVRDLFIARAELLQKAGHFPHLTVYELAEMLYDKHISQQRETP